jgi:hypothetical protein
MEASAWRERGEPALFRAIARAWDFGSRTQALRYPPGVHKHRSIGELNALTEAWDEANFRAFRERRAASLSSKSQAG